MPRVPLKMKYLGNLPRGVWRMIMNMDGSVLFVCDENQPRILDAGRLRILKSPEVKNGDEKEDSQEG